MEFSSEISENISSFSLYWSLEVFKGLTNEDLMIFLCSLNLIGGTYAGVNLEQAIGDFLLPMIGDTAFILVSMEPLQQKCFVPPKVSDWELNVLSPFEFLDWYLLSAFVFFFFYPDFISELFFSLILDGDDEITFKPLR